MAFERAEPVLWWGAPWPDVLTGVGTVSLALFAVITVMVTSRQAARDRREALDEVLMARSRRAAERIYRALAEAWPNLALTAYGVTVDYGKYQTELSLERPLLADDQLQKQVEILAGKIQDLLTYTMVIPAADDPDVPRTAEVRSRMTRSRHLLTMEISQYATWVQDSLAAHISGKPLPSMPRPRIGGRSRHLNEFSELYYPDDL